MKNSSKAFSIMALCTLTLAGAPFAFGQESGLAVSVRTNTKSYSRGVPVFAHVALKNVGSVPVNVSVGGTYQLQVLNPEGVFEEVQFRDVQVSVVGPPKQFKPGEEKKGTIALWFGTRRPNREGRQLIFDVPGKHTFRMRYVGRVAPQGLHESIAFEALSNEVTITIEPEGEGFEEYIQLMRQHTLDMTLLPKGIDPAKAFVAGHPDSNYALYTKALLLDALYSPFGEDREQQEALQRDPKSVSWAEEVLAGLGPDAGSLSVAAQYVLAMGRMIEGRQAEADRIIQSFRDRWGPGSPYVIRLESVKARLKRR